MQIFSNDEAFAPFPEELSVSIENPSGLFTFTRNWFVNRNQKTWSTYFPIKYSNDRPINMMQIGVFEGMDIVWCMQNILRHPESRVLGIDPWMATRKIPMKQMEEVRVRAYDNMQVFRHQCRLIRMKSQDIMPTLISSPAVINDKQITAGQWDLIIIDGDHTANAVFEDAENALALAAPGAWLVFDDVRNRIYKKDHVVHGLERFVDAHPNEVKFEWAHRHCDCWSKI